MVKAKDGTDSVESFEMEVAEEEEEEEEEESDDDDDDEVFVKKGGRHGNENGSAKKPLIKGNLNRVIFRERKKTKFWRFLDRVLSLPGNKARNGKRNGALHTEIREGESFVNNQTFKA